MKKFVVLFFVLAMIMCATCALADKLCVGYEDEFVLVTADGTFVCYEDEFVYTVLLDKVDVFKAYHVDGDNLVPCEVVETENGLYIRTFSFNNYNATEEIWRCTWF